MAGYILLDLEIIDPEGFKEYLKLAGPMVKQYGGKVLVGGAVPENLDGYRDRCFAWYWPFYCQGAGKGGHEPGAGRTFRRRIGTSSNRR